MLSLNLAQLPSADATVVSFTPERLFGRHCAVLGTTGGGKSWTLARLAEQVALRDGKVLLIDATGEFATLRNATKHVHVGNGPAEPESSTEVTFPYSDLTEGDLFSLFKPSGQAQAPKLRAAIKSLKLASLAEELASDGLIIMADQLKDPIMRARQRYAASLEGPTLDFSIDLLPRQINEECVWMSGRSGDYTVWGGYNEQEKAYCVTLVTRIEDTLQAPELSCIFHPGEKPTLKGVVTAFLGAPERILRVSLKYLPFEHNAREIVANALGRYLLGLARGKTFVYEPLLVFVDEAHQFLDRVLGDEYTQFPLDSFGLIAKEGRKFGLNICIATQRPRDVPEGVLSQVGTLIVHRLTNDQDRSVVERASGDIDRAAAAFLPTLPPGRAVIIGADFPIPITVQIIEPNQKPDSSGPDYQGYWHASASQPNPSE